MKTKEVLGAIKQSVPPRFSKVFVRVSGISSGCYVEIKNYSKYRTKLFIEGMTINLPDGITEPKGKMFSLIGF